VIANQTFGDDFGDCGDYLRRGRGRVDPSQRVGWVEFQNLPTRRMDIAERIMAGTASLSYTRKPVLHLSISFAPGDPVNEALMKRVMARTLTDLGLGEHQAVIVAHIDTDDPHVHAMVNRVHPETGVAWKGSWSRLRTEASLRQQELDEGLRVVPGWLARVPGHPELRPRPRLARADGEFLREVRERAEPVLKRARSWADVEAGLAEFRLSVRVNGRGMSVTDGRQVVKASEVGPQFSRGNLEEQFGRYSDYRARVAVASAISVRDAGGASPARVGIESKAPPETRAASEAQPRFSLYEDDGIFGVWDSRGPQIFFADTRERAEAEMKRAEWLVARYPNIHAVRCLRDMDVACRESRGLPLLPEETRRPPRTVYPVQAAEPAVQPASRAEERSDPAPVTAPAPVRRNTSFRDEVRSKADSALRLSDSWVELEHDLAALGLFLRVQGGGFVVTDGEREVKASEVGREFSRFYLEKRLGHYPQPGVATSPAETAPSFSASATPPDPARQPQEIAPSPTSTQIDVFEGLETMARVLSAGAPERSQAIQPVREEEEVTPWPADHEGAGDVARIRSTPTPDVRTSESAGGAASEPATGLTPTTHDPSSLPVRNGSTDAHAFLQSFELFQQSRTLRNEVEKLDDARGKIATWSGALERTTRDVKGATHEFATQIRAAFRDPRAFTDLFEHLTEVQKRATLKTLGEQPAEFAREFLAASGDERPTSDEQPGGWRARISKAAERLRRTPPEQHVFRNPSDARGAGILTAGAGERYLNAVLVRDSVRRRIAGELDLSEEVPLPKVREELLTRTAVAEAQKAEALRLRETLKAPTVEELKHMFLDLRPEDQQRVTRAAPAITSLLPNAMRIADGLVSGPERKSRGLDW
jgi:hypothetical protein